ncbi:hypothetical protein JN531_005310 [Flagellatimonas centrodinii]|uniref:hypothetical protein n=1 Tax=Flagellatimonas centrodinii TaxID=2806210 RepID=UPI001FEF5B1F|nr:hypothetical protein [Flagellatimonas centrodinii]ULQ47705.1 hypothetical protein JN531_005310 [Flagellatimonas centrodinii]
MRHSILMVLSAVALVACGGGSEGGDGTSPADPLFAAYSDVLAGDFRGVRADGPGLQTEPPDRICYRQLPVDRASTERAVAQQGGVVTEASESRWCAELPGGPLCLEALPEQGFVLDDGRQPGTAEADVSLVLPLAEGRLAQFQVEIRLLGSQALRDLEMRVMQPADDFPVGASCESVPDSFEGPETLDGQWSGHRVVYNPADSSGGTLPASMSCEGNTCTLSGTPDTPLGFTLQSFGIWTLADAGLEGRAIRSNDGMALAIWLCESSAVAQQSHPFDEGCYLYGFNRLIPG